MDGNTNFQQSKTLILFYLPILYTPLYGESDNRKAKRTIFEKAPFEVLFCFIGVVLQKVRLFGSRKQRFFQTLSDFIVDMKLDIILSKSF